MVPCQLYSRFRKSLLPNQCRCSGQAIAGFHWHHMTISGSGPHPSQLQASVTGKYSQCTPFSERYYSHLVLLPSLTMIERFTKKSSISMIIEVEHQSAARGDQSFFIWKFYFRWEAYEFNFKFQRVQWSVIKIRYNYAANDQVGASQSTLIPTLLALLHTHRSRESSDNTGTTTLRLESDSIITDCNSILAQWHGSAKCRRFKLISLAVMDRDFRGVQNTLEFRIGWQQVLKPAIARTIHIHRHSSRAARNLGWQTNYPA